MSYNAITRSIEKCFAEHMPSEKRPAKIGYCRNNIHYLPEPARFQMEFRTMIGKVFLILTPDAAGWSPMVITHFVPEELWPTDLVLTVNGIPVAKRNDINVLKRRFSLTTSERIISTCSGILFGNHIGYGQEPTRRDLIHAIQSTYESTIIPPVWNVPREDDAATEASG